jgi:nucleotide-binding universal stress UspA family protein
MNILEQKTSTRIALNNVLFATDFSAAAEAALPYAVAICRRYGSTLHAVHVIPEFNILVHAETVNPVTFESAYEAELHDARERMKHLRPDLEGIPHHTYIHRGKLWNVLSQILSEERIDLLIVGTHGRTGVGKLLMGSVAEEIVRQATCPVLTVGPNASGRIKQEFQTDGKDFAPAELELRQILFATDFTPESLAGAPFAISLAEEFQARLALLHVIEEHDRERPSPTEWALERLGRLVPSEASLWCKAESFVKFGSPAECILQAASEHNPDLIVLGVRPAGRRLGAVTHLPWATAHKVIAHASCPVLTVRK